jgi:hypothetical protein
VRRCRSACRTSRTSCSRPSNAQPQSGRRLQGASRPSWHAGRS